MDDEKVVLKELNDSDFLTIIEDCQNKNVGVELYLNNKIRLLYLPVTMAPDKVNWLRRKRNTALHFAMSTFQFNKKIKNNETLIETKYGLCREDYTSIPGSLPLLIEKTSEFGTLTVTGLEPEEDHKFVLKLLDKFR